MISFGFTMDDVKRAVWTALQAGGFTLLAGLGGLLDAFNEGGFSGSQAAGLALVVAAGGAVLSALKNFVLAPSSKLR